VSSAYFDSSAIVKLLKRERRHEEVEHLWTSSALAFASRLTPIEVIAALGASHRNHEVSTTALAELEQMASGFRRELVVVELSDEVEALARHLAPRLALRGADAVHLASALALEDPDLVLATWDRRLHAAARAEGLRVAPATI
jgi:predicted nucleic acid-binding protein